MATSDPTSRFTFTHVGLRVVDIERSVAFYSKAFGMTEIFRMELETSTVVFLPKSLTLTTTKPNLPRYSKENGSWSSCVLRSTLTDNDCAASTHDFRRVKLAFSVPNVAEAIEHMSQFDVKVVKPIDQSSGSAGVAKFLGCEVPDKGFDVDFWKMCRPVPFVEDPLADGNLIELIPQRT